MVLSFSWSFPFPLNYTIVKYGFFYVFLLWFYHFISGYRQSTKLLNQGCYIVARGPLEEEEGVRINISLEALGFLYDEYEETVFCWHLVEARHIMKPILFAGFMGWYLG